MTIEHNIYRNDIRRVTRKRVSDRKKAMANGEGNDENVAPTMKLRYRHQKRSERNEEISKKKKETFEKTLQEINKQLKVVENVKKGTLKKLNQQQQQKQKNVERANIIENITTDIQSFFDKSNIEKQEQEDHYNLQYPNQKQQDGFTQKSSEEEFHNTQLHTILTKSQKITSTIEEEDYMEDIDNEESQKGKDDQVESIFSLETLTDTLKHKLLTYKPYLKDIHQSMLDIEKMYIPKQNYTNNEDHPITKRHRNILVNWIVKLHNHYHHNKETLDLTINILDRYLAIEKVDKSNLQIVATACFLIAAKYHQLFSELENFVNHLVGDVNQLFNADELKQMESTILNRLNFEVSSVTLEDYLKYYLILINASKPIYEFAEYLSKLVYYNETFIETPPSTLAYSIVFFAHFFGCFDPTNPFWYAELCVASNYTHSHASVKPTCNILYEMLHREWYLHTNEETRTRVAAASQQILNSTMLDTVFEFLDILR